MTLFSCFVSWNLKADLTFPAFLSLCAPPSMQPEWPECGQMLMEEAAQPALDSNTTWLSKHNTWSMKCVGWPVGLHRAKDITQDMMLSAFLHLYLCEITCRRQNVGLTKIETTQFGQLNSTFTPGPEKRVYAATLMKSLHKCAFQASACKTVLIMCYYASY